MAYQPRHTWNEFKSKVKEMNTEEKKEFLKELQLEHMEAYTRKFQSPDVAKMRTLRKKIAYMKTIMNMKGFHYKPRGNNI